ncbi:hypothetical protein B0H14DRAFT_2318652, partial [Mycena olivaceomarginata]
FLDHSRNVDIANSGSMTVHYMTTCTQSLVPGLSVLITASDHDHDGECCALCGHMVDKTMKRCRWCKFAQYCVPDVRACQKIDWPYHKKGC